MNRQQAKQLGQAIGFTMCGLMTYMIGWSLLRALASTLKQKTAPQQQRKRGAVSMSRYTGSLTGCLLCVKR